MPALIIALLASYRERDNARVMKKIGGKIVLGALLKRYPIRGKTPGWYFSIRETSANVWLVEGSDAFGRQVSRQGTDEEGLLAQCEADAREINGQQPAE